MTETDESRAPPMGAVVSIKDELSKWFCRPRVAPVERIRRRSRNPGVISSTIVAGGARQNSKRPATSAAVVSSRGKSTCSISAGAWGGGRPVSNPVDHGCDYLFSHLYMGDGRWHTSLDSTTRVPRAPFSLYEQAFYLFALAQLHPTMDGLRADIGYRPALPGAVAQ